MARDRQGQRARSKSELLRQLAKVRGIERASVATAGAHPETRLLALWQARRLAATYRDFGAQPRYALAVEYFLQDLYGPRDFAQRDADLEKVLPIMSRTLPAAALDALGSALELQALTQELDAVMLDMLCGKLDMTDTLTPGMWCEAYRLTGRRAQRERQLFLIERAGLQLDEVVARPLIYTLVILARGPARAAGFGDLQSLVERGFKAFRDMRGAAEFIAAVVARETAIIEQLFAGKTPAAWQDDPGTLALTDLPAEQATGVPRSDPKKSG